MIILNAYRESKTIKHNYFECILLLQVLTHTELTCILLAFLFPNEEKPKNDE